MNRSIVAAALIALAATLPAQARPKSDEDQIRGKANAFRQAWNKHDIKGMAAFWADDGDLINPFGRVATGRGEIETLFADEHSTFMKETTFNVDHVAVRILTPDVALAEWAITVNGIKAPDGATSPPMKHRVTIVYQKKGADWWAVAVRPILDAPKPGGATPEASTAKTK